MTLIAKVGGSLYDLPDLGPRLTAWLASQPDDVILVPGGGPMVETLRLLDRTHHLGEEACHWLALRLLTINAQFLAHLLPGASIISDPATWLVGRIANPSDMTGYRSAGTVSILDMYAFALADDDNPGRLPHSWDVTSDSLALRVAIQTKARHLVLLKSVDHPTESATLDGIVDDHFRELRRQAPDLAIQIVNLRTAF